MTTEELLAKALVRERQHRVDQRRLLRETERAGSRAPVRRLPQVLDRSQRASRDRAIRHRRAA